MHWLILGCVRASLWHVGSLVAACGLLSSCGSQVPECVGSAVVSLRFGCPVACGILVPRPRTEPPLPALEGRFVTPGPPRKSLIVILVCIFFRWLMVDWYIVWFLVNFETFLYILHSCLLLDMWFANIFSPGRFMGWQSRTRLSDWTELNWSYLLILFT